MYKMEKVCDSDVDWVWNLIGVMYWFNFFFGFFVFKNIENNFIK